MVAISVAKWWQSSKIYQELWQFGGKILGKLWEKVAVISMNLSGFRENRGNPGKKSLTPAGSLENKRKRLDNRRGVFVKPLSVYLQTCRYISEIFRRPDRKPGAVRNKSNHICFHFFHIHCIDPVGYQLSELLFR